MAQVLYLLSSFRSRDFRLLWLSTLISSAGMSMQQIAVGWLVLEMTNSPLSLGIASASRMAPFLLLGMIAGTMADRLNRRNLLMAVNGLAAVYSLSMALVVIAGVVQFWHVVTLTLLFGCSRALESPARQALIYDIVGSNDALKGMSLNTIAMRLMAVFGGLLGGVMIASVGVQGSFLFMSLSYIIGSLILLGMGQTSIKKITEPIPFLRSLRATIGMLRGNSLLLALFVMSLLAEIFAFSHNTLLPVFARDVLAVGPVGLGLLNSSLALGGITASLILAAITNYANKVQLLLWALGFYGLSLLLFSLSHSYILSLAIIVCVGAAASSFDILQQTVMQMSVPDAERGRAMGYWVASLGFGPIGHVELGALAGLVGAPLALGTHAGIIIATYCIMTVFVTKRLHKGDNPGYSDT